MRIIRALLIYFAVVFLGGALLSPWLFWLAQAAAPNSHLATSPFHRFVDRTLMGLAILGIWPLLRSIGATSFRDVGLVKPAGQWRRLGAGFAMGLGSFAIIAAIAVLGKGRQINPELSSQITFKLVAGTLATVALVPLLEEVLFRGALFGALRKACNWRVALVVSSMLYAIVHFMTGKDVDPTGPIHWYSGLEVLPKMLQGFAKWDAVIPGFFTLTLVGVLLGLAYQRTGNLYFSIGLHGGWIFWIKFYRVLTVPVDGANTWLWGSNNPIDGLLALGLLAVMWIAMVLAKGNGE